MLKASVGAENSFACSLHHFKNLQEGRYRLCHMPCQQQLLWHGVKLKVASCASGSAAVCSHWRALVQHEGKGQSAACGFDHKPGL